MDSDIGFKRCWTCKKVRERVNFHKATNNRDGLQSSCIECSDVNRKLAMNKRVPDPVLMERATKLCGGCGTVKKAKEFHRNGRSRDGLQGWCKKCTNVAVREYQARKKAKELAANA